MNDFVNLYRRIVWAGITVNILFVLPLLLVPTAFLGLFGIDIDQPVWARASGALMFIITVFYIPGAMDPIRYKLFTWMHALSARGVGATFFLVAVLCFDQPLGFLSIALVDAFFGITSLYALLKMQDLEERVR
jgi:hypothetical protein